MKSCHVNSHLYHRSTSQISFRVLESHRFIVSLYLEILTILSESVTEFHFSNFCPFITESFIDEFQTTSWIHPRTWTDPFRVRVVNSWTSTATAEDEEWSIFPIFFLGKGTEQILQTPQYIGGDGYESLSLTSYQSRFNDRRHADFGKKWSE